MDFSGINPYLIAREDYPIPMLTPEEQKAMLEKLAEKNQKKVVEMASPSKVITPDPSGKLSEKPSSSSSASVKVSVPYGMDREYADLRQKLEAATHRAIQEQTGGVSQMEQTLQGIKNSPRQVDWSALASYFDSTVPGSKLSQGYKAPETEAERQTRIAQLEGAIQKAKEGISDKEIDSMKALLNTHMYNKAIQAQGRNERQEKAFDIKLFQDAAKQQKKLLEDAGDFNQSVTVVKNALTPDSKGNVKIGNVKAALAQFARTMGNKGAQSEGDIERSFYKTWETTFADYAAKLSGDPSQPIPLAAVQPMIDSINAAEQGFENSYRSRADGFVRSHFENPGSPFQGRTWGPGIVDEVYKPVGGREKKETDPSIKEWEGKKYQLKGDKWVEVK